MISGGSSRVVKKVGLVTGASIGGPSGFNFYYSSFGESVMPETAPRVVFRTLYKFSLDWIAVDVSKLLGELFVVADVAVVIALLPKRMNCNLLG